MLILAIIIASVLGQETNPYSLRHNDFVMSQKACYSTTIGLDFVSAHMSQAVNRLVEFYNHPLKYEVQRNGSDVYAAMRSGGKKNTTLDLEFEFVNRPDRVEKVQV